MRGRLMACFAKDAKTRGATRTRLPAADRPMMLDSTMYFYFLLPDFFP